jgi:MFS family permease
MISMDSVFDGTNHTNEFIKTSITGNEVKSIKFPSIQAEANIKSPGLMETSINKQYRSDSHVLFGVPRSLLPLYCSFILDSIALGIVMPLLPFFAIQLGANAFELSLVVSSNYLAQMIGCIVMGLVSDAYGRRPVLLICLAASSIQYFTASYTNNLVQLSLARIISGMFGGLVPIMQSCVADVAIETDRPKYLGRITASFGLGFVLGPLISGLISGFEIRDKIRLACVFPFFGYLISFIFFKETNQNVKDRNRRSPLFSSKRKSIFSFLTPNKHVSSLLSTNDKNDSENNVKTTFPSTSITKLKPEIFLLVMNGFLLMYAFATETVYAIFIKDTFGMGEQSLSLLFACNGILIGIFQVFLIKPLISHIGKHATLALGNAILALGMIGIAMIRVKVVHFIIFAVHVVGYSIADTALSSLVTRYSSSDSQGRALSLNQAAQACARVVSPLFAGLLYEYSKKLRFRSSSLGLPVGALPFLIGSIFPATAIAIPTILYMWGMNKKLREKSREEEEEDSLLERADGQ